MRNRVHALAALLCAIGILELAACVPPPNFSPASESAVVEIPWKTGEFEHEGFPLLLRAPLHLDYDRQPELTQLVIVTHVLERVQSSGLPESVYNSGLEDFDHQMTALFSEHEYGLTLLVETFAGKRTYYSYVKPEAPVQDLVEAVRSAHPGHELVVETELDPGWRLIRGYSSDYGL